MTLSLRDLLREQRADAARGNANTSKILSAEIFRNSQQGRTHMQRRHFLSAGLFAAGALGAGIAGKTPAEAGPGTLEFVGLDGWLNTDAPMSVAGLRGKVVLVDFWTYSCINCRRTIPYLNRWQSEYGPRGLQVIGIHTPEFGFERARRNVEADVQALGIRYPVAQDNAFGTWKAWNNRAWPTFYLLDQEGRLVLLREGEGHAREMESAIRGLLGLTGAPVVQHRNDDPDLSRIGSPEIYFGAMHPTPQEHAQSPRKGEAAYAFTQAPNPRLNRYSLDGTWARDEEPLVLRSARGGLRLHFSASKVHLVASAPNPTPLKVTVDEQVPRLIEVSRPTLYTVFDSDDFREHRLSLESDAPGLSLFSATFG
jgi:thiol-disulfide isomerase/thioredoxin